VEGSEATLRLLAKAFEKLGISELDPVGERFDPERHEAIARVPSADLPDITVAGETARGYLLHGRVLRPAMVTVAVTPEDPGSSPADA
jgi:molecular chaperone GrpE